MNKFGKFLLCLSIPALMASTGCAIYYGIECHNLDKQVVEDDSGMVNVVDELRKSVASLETEKANLTQQLTLLQEQYDALNQLRENLENTNNTLETENAELQTQIDELNAQNAQLETQITDLNKQITSLNTQIETLNKTLEDNKTASDEEIASLQVQVTTLQAQVNSLNSTIDNLNAEIDSYEANTIALNTEIANLNNTIDEYEQEIENYKKIIEELKKINSCVVTFIVDGQVVSTQQVNKTESPVAIDDPSSESYIFDGWTISGSTEIIDPFTYSVTEDMEFVASIRKYKVVTFTVDDEVISTQSIITDDELQLPVEPTKEHYSFLGWSLDGENVIDLTSYSFTQDTNLIAVFEVVGQLSYTFDGNAITSYTGTESEVVIPSSYSILEEGIYVEGNDYQVTTINSGVFVNNTNINKITIPTTITKIVGSAFSGCINLTEVHISDLTSWCNITYNHVYGNPLAYAKNLYLNNVLIEDLVIPTTITTINPIVFYGGNFKSLTISENVVEIGEYAFAECLKLTEINFNANNVSDFSKNQYVFSKVGQDNNGITLNIGSNVQKIPAFMFYPSGDTGISVSAATTYTPNIKTINFSKNDVMTSIGSYAFWNLRNLTEVNYSVTNCDLFYNSYIFGFAGVDGDGVTLNVGANVQKIPAYMFCVSSGNSYLPKLIAVNFDENSVCTTIGSYAFGYAENLASFDLPASVQEIGNNAFYWCRKFKSVNVDNSVLYNSLTSLTASGYYINYATTIKVLKSIVDDSNNSNTFLNDTTKYAKTEEGNYYIYTKV